MTNWFLKGIASIVDLSGSLFRPDTSDIVDFKTPGHVQDAEALKRDWEELGKDMRKVVKKGVNDDKNN